MVVAACAGAIPWVLLGIAIGIIGTFLTWGRP